MTLDIFQPKTRERILKLHRAVKEAQDAGGNADLPLINAVKALKRIARRAETLPEGYERVEIAQKRGPTIEFTGHLLAETQFDTGGADPMTVHFELWETRGKALVTVATTWPASREGFEIASALVVGPSDDELARQIAVMEHFDWHDRARSMVKILDWSLRLEVE